MWIMEFLHIYPIEDQPQDLRGSDNNWSRCSICGCNQEAYDEVSRTSCEPYFCCQTLWMFSLCNIVIRHKDWKTQPCMRWISTVQQNVLSSSGCQLLLYRLLNFLFSSPYMDCGISPDPGTGELKASPRMKNRTSHIVDIYCEISKNAMNSW